MVFAQKIYFAKKFKEALPQQNKIKGTKLGDDGKFWERLADDPTW